MRKNKKINNIKSKEVIKLPSEEAIENTKKTLVGFNMDEYVAKPLDQNIIIRREITSIPAKKPNSQQYFRIHPNLEVTVDVIDWKEEGTLYLVKQDQLLSLFEQAKRVTLYVGMFLSGNPFLFPVPQPDEQGHWNAGLSQNEQVMTKDSSAREPTYQAREVVNESQ